MTQKEKKEEIKEPKEIINEVKTPAQDPFSLILEKTSNLEIVSFIFNLKFNFQEN